MLDDETESKVMKLSSSSYKYYSMKNLSNPCKTILWDIKAEHGFIVYVYVTTMVGAKYLSKINFKNIGNDGFSLALFGTKVSDSE